ncbi:MAG: nicotinate (nicotinamide) nucleotide adenylyltransferase [Bacteroidia bacterium]
MKIGLLFGSFNPIHVGHMVIANYMLEFTDLERLWIVVSPHNPLKEKKGLLANNHRFALVQEAIGDHPKMKASKIEFNLPQPSYTINTLTYLKEKHPKDEFVLIMGSDNLNTFHKWKNYESILENYQLYIYPRPNEVGDDLKNHPNVKITEAPLMDISSSFIREAIRNKKNVSHFMPEPVARYVQEMNFYKK